MRELTRIQGPDHPDVAEPDARNEKSIGLLQRVGFVLGPRVDALPMPGGGTSVGG